MIGRFEDGVLAHLVEQAIGESGDAKLVSRPSSSAVGGVDLENADGVWTIKCAVSLELGAPLQERARRLQSLVLDKVAEMSEISVRRIDIDIVEVHRAQEHPTTVYGEPIEGSGNP